MSERMPSIQSPERRERERPLDFATISLLGKRAEQEDMHGVELMDLDGVEVLVAMVADGHGRQGVDAARESVVKAFGVIEQSNRADENVIAKAFKEAHDRMKEVGVLGGCTLTLAVVEGDVATIGWVGDSQAKIFTDSNELQTVTLPHIYGKHMEETKRLKRENAKIGDPSYGGYGATGSATPRNVIFKGSDYIEVSRAIGDTDMEPYVVHEPEIQKVELGESDRFLVIASDGLWNELEDPLKLKKVEMALAVSDTAEDARQQLFGLLTQWSLEDNTTVVIVNVGKYQDVRDKGNA
jgi:serine/threonine protein phosphatase PrpC